MQGTFDNESASWEGVRCILSFFLYQFFSLLLLQNYKTLGHIQLNYVSNNKLSITIMIAGK